MCLVFNEGHRLQRKWNSSCSMWKHNQQLYFDYIVTLLNLLTSSNITNTVFQDIYVSSKRHGICCLQKKMDLLLLQYICFLKFFLALLHYQSSGQYCGNNIIWVNILLCPWYWMECIHFSILRFGRFYFLLPYFFLLSTAILL